MWQWFIAEVKQSCYECAKRWERQYFVRCLLRVTSPNLADRTVDWPSFGEKQGSSGRCVVKKRGWILMRGTQSGQNREWGPFFAWFAEWCQVLAWKGGRWNMPQCDNASSGSQSCSNNRAGLRPVHAGGGAANGEWQAAAFTCEPGTQER